MAATILVAVETRGAWANELLGRELERAGVRDPRDRALTTELVYGVLRWRRRLDHALVPRVRQGLDRLEPVARALLRVGAYQVRMLDRIPTPVAVSATQDAARALGAGRLTGLLNGVLRRVASDPEELPSGDADAAIGVRASLPDWIVGLLRMRWPDAVEREALALRERSATTIRPTRARGGAEAARAALEAEGFTAEPGLNGTLAVTGPGDPFATKAFGEGLFVPQDPASVHVLDLVGAAPGERVLDLCAGRGIKSTGLADRGVHVLAVDVDGRKLEEARGLAERLGVADRMETRAADATRTDLDLGTFSRVLVDAPCTGLGTIRRHPEIAWNRRPADVGRMADLQARLLAAAARHVAPGGELIYAVCSFAPAEGRPPSPAGFEPAEEPLATRPSDGVDAFQVLRWRRPGG
ncbi:MAG: transcription antitermination factor NusB [Myxococcota bacterium]